MPNYIIVNDEGKIVAGIVAEDLESAKSFIGPDAMEAPYYAVPTSRWMYNKETNDYIYVVPVFEEEV
jgi:hypothetical protein